MSVPSLLSIFGNSGGGPPILISEIFKTNLYTANNSAVTITNSIDLAGEGGMVWGKSRSANQNHRLYDTEGNGLYPNLTATQFGTSSRFTANSNGFSLTAASGIVGGSGYGGPNYVAWTFRKAPGFFDIVEYTGDGTSTQTINHNLDSVPGMIMFKNLDSQADWHVYHRSTTSGYYLRLNSFSGQTNAGGSEFSSLTSSSFTFDRTYVSNINTSGVDYVAYIFAHDDARFGTGRDETVIKCDTYNGIASNSSYSVSCGFKPGWVLIKTLNPSADTTNAPSSPWVIIDNQRSDAAIYPDNSVEENGYDAGGYGITFTSTGFNIASSNSAVNYGYGRKYVYVAIREP